MSSSTSLFDPIPPRDGAGRVWLYSLAITAAVLLAMMSVVAVVDPYNSKLLTQRLEIDRVSAFRVINIPQWAAFEFARDPASLKKDTDILIIGDSRGEQLRGGPIAARALQFQDYKFYDLSFGSATGYEMMSVYRTHKKDFPKAHTLIIVMALTKLLPRSIEIDRTADSQAAAQNPLLYLLSYSAFKNSVNWLLSGDAPAEDTQDDVGPKSQSKSKTKPLKSFKKHFNFIKQVNVHGASVLETEIAPFIAEVKSAGLRPIIMIPPTHPQLREATRGLMKGDEDQLIARLSELADVFQTPEDFDRTQCWSDAVHVCKDAAAQLLPMLVSKMLPTQ